MLTYERSGKAMKKDIRKDIFTIIAVTVAAFLMALNTKTNDHCTDYDFCYFGIRKIIENNVT